MKTSASPMKGYSAAGRDVAVKVQRPNVRDLVLCDLDALDEVAPILERFSGVARSVEVPGVLTEFRRTMMRELDLRARGT